MALIISKTAANCPQKINSPKLAQGERHWQGPSNQTLQQEGIKPGKIKPL